MADIGVVVVACWACLSGQDWDPVRCVEVRCQDEDPDAWLADLRALQVPEEAGRPDWAECEPRRPEGCPPGCWPVWVGGTWTCDCYVKGR